MKKVKELKASNLKNSFNIDSLKFNTTEEVEPSPTSLTIFLDISVIIERIVEAISSENFIFLRIEKPSLVIKCPYIWSCITVVEP